MYFGVTALTSRTPRELVEQETGYARARDRASHDCVRMDLGTGGPSTGAGTAPMSGDRLFLDTTILL